MVAGPQPRLMASVELDQQPALAYELLEKTGEALASPLR